MRRRLPPGPDQTGATAGDRRRGAWSAPLSLQARVLIAAALLLLVFVLLTGLALERAIRDSALAAREARLLGQVYLLMAAAEADAEAPGLRLPELLEEPRFNLPDSGLYGQISDADGAVVWRSPSAVGRAPPFLADLRPGETRFSVHRDALVQGYGVRWSTGPWTRDFTFSVAEEPTELRAELARFRASLLRGLGLMSLLLLLALLVLLRWGLRPLRQVAAEVAAMEAGSGRRLTGSYPRELTPLTDNLNALLAWGEAREARLANALDDLAHSLKTPLAVMRGAVSDDPATAAAAPLLTEQLARMQQILTWQLERARAAAPRPAALAARVPVRPLVQRLAAALVRLHADKAVRLVLDIPPALHCRGNEGDLMELLGNLLDNAFKWCRGVVAVSAGADDAGLWLRVADDGPGIPGALAHRLLERGVRGDESTPGQGIGLAVVREIAAAYGGQVRIARATEGGALIQVRLPV